MFTEGFFENLAFEKFSCCMVSPDAVEVTNVMSELSETFI